MQDLIIATGLSRTSKQWHNTKISWDGLKDRLKDTQRTSETQGQYFNMTKKQQDNLKDVGGFVGGRLEQGVRKAGTVKERYLLTLDADFATPDFIDTMELFHSRYSWIIYSTHKHTPDKPRYRLVVPLSRPTSPDEYEAIGRKVAEDIGIDMFDDTTYQAHRLMYWPSTSRDAEYIFKCNDANPLDVDYILGTYADWKDVSLWPVSSRTERVKERLLKKQENPLEKKGIVGAFCRTYTIDEAIEKFLYDQYEPCINGRYTYKNGSTSAGAVVYENGLFLYSNHATDPASGMLCNAFDLVRVHMFGENDYDAVAGTPTAKLPSYIMMAEFAREDEGVKKTQFLERQASAAEDFGEFLEDEEEKENTTESEEDENAWAVNLEAGKQGYKSTIDNVFIILRNDRRIKKKIRFNEFTRKTERANAMPWIKEKCITEWTDTDDSGLRHYLENVYDIKGKSVIDDAFKLTAQANAYHPVRDYLDSLKWDGVSRLERLFIDYQGAEDNIYTRTVTRKALVAAVARVFNPGCKWDYVVTLVGPQGCGKSTMIKIIGRGWYSDSLTTVVGKEAFEQLQGVWIIEIGELSAMKKSDIEAIKLFISKCEDSYRAAYGHYVETHKRQCIFIATTNKHDFLRDMTGNRRFFPIDCHPEKATKSIWQELEGEIDQIWAEAVHYFKAGERLFLEGDALHMAEEEQDKHLEENPLTGAVKMYLDKPIPSNWDKLDQFAKVQYYNNSSGEGDFDFEYDLKDKKIRDKVCILEMWCELFGGQKKDLNRQKSNELAEIILKTGEWERAEKTMHFGGMYGKQKGFKRIM